VTFYKDDMIPSLLRPQVSHPSIFVQVNVSLFYLIDLDPDEEDVHVKMEVDSGVISCSKTHTNFIFYILRGYSVIGSAPAKRQLSFYYFHTLAISRGLKGLSSEI
jgi:hypothetical protein